MFLGIKRSYRRRGFGRLFDIVGCIMHWDIAAQRV